MTRNGRAPSEFVASRYRVKRISRFFSPGRDAADGEPFSGPSPATLLNSRQDLSAVCTDLPDNMRTRASEYVEQVRETGSACATENDRHTCGMPIPSIVCHVEDTPDTSEH